MTTTSTTPSQGSTGSRGVILARVRAALGDVPNLPAEEDTPIQWSYGQATAVDDVLERFIDRIIDYKARLVRVPAEEVPSAIAQALVDCSARSAVVPSGLPQEWRQALGDAGILVVEDDPPLSHDRLNELDAVVTAAAVAAAESGTIILDHRADQGRRALSLVPDVHVCVVRTDQVVTDVPEAVARLGAAVEEQRPLTWISGGSATSDIELSRVEGVHGPRTLFVVLAD